MIDINTLKDVVLYEHLLGGLLISNKLANIEGLEWQIDEICHYEQHPLTQVFFPQVWRFTQQQNSTIIETFDASGQLLRKKTIETGEVRERPQYHVYVLDKDEKMNAVCCLGYEHPLLSTGLLPMQLAETMEYFLDSEKDNAGVRGAVYERLVALWENCISRAVYYPRLSERVNGLIQSHHERVS